MDIDEALKLAEGINPKLIIPMHFNTFEEIRVDPYDMAKKNDKVVVMKVGVVIEVNP